jgi:hypothetical protein
LFELDGQRLLQRVVKDGVAGGVGEVGEDDGVFFGELGGLACAPEVEAGSEGGEPDNS